MVELEEQEGEDDTSRVSIGYNEEIFSPHHRDDDQPTLIIDNTENDYYKNRMFADPVLK